MTIKTFIEKARDGGYNPHRIIITAELFLDPEAWKAVGKVEGWAVRDFNQSIPARVTHRVTKNGTVAISNVAHIRRMRKPTPLRWKTNMHGMIDALAEGKTIEDYLSSL